MCSPALPTAFAFPPDHQFIAEADGRLLQLGEGANAVVYLAKLQGLYYVAVKVP